MQKMSPTWRLVVKKARSGMSTSASSCGSCGQGVSGVSINPAAPCGHGGGDWRFLALSLGAEPRRLVPSARGSGLPAAPSQLRAELGGAWAREWLSLSQKAEAGGPYPPPRAQARPDPKGKGGGGVE
jgi:hypothetical protein